MRSWGLGFPSNQLPSTCHRLDIGAVNGVYPPPFLHPRFFHMPLPSTPHRLPSSGHNVPCCCPTTIARNGDMQIVTDDGCELSRGIAEHASPPLHGAQMVA